MHPAYSVIIFTTMSGAGFGLLVWLAALALLGQDRDHSPALGIVGARTCVCADRIGPGLIDRPPRAAGARLAGIFAVAHILAFARGRSGRCDVRSGRHFCAELGIWRSWTGIFGAAAVLAIALAFASVYATGMIYQSLTTIRAWAHPLVAPIYVALAMATGGTLAVFVLRAFGDLPNGVAEVSIAFNLLAAILKYAYWQGIDNQERTHTAGDATGLGRFGTVRVLDQPHTQANFVMREMGYTVARKHAKTLRMHRAQPWLRAANCSDGRVLGCTDARSADSRRTCRSRHGHRHFDGTLAVLRRSPARRNAVLRRAACLNRTALTGTLPDFRAPVRNTLGVCLNKSIRCNRLRLDRYLSLLHDKPIEDGNGRSLPFQYGLVTRSSSEPAKLGHYHMRWVLGILVVAGLAAGGYAWRQMDVQPASQPAVAATASSAVVVNAAHVKVGNIRRQIEAVGSLRSDELVIVRPEIAGRISEILFEEGHQGLTRHRARSPRCRDRAGAGRSSRTQAWR